MKTLDGFKEELGMSMRHGADDIRASASRLSAYRMSRRGVLRLISAGASSSAFVALLAACGGGSSSTPTTAASSSTSSAGATTTSSSATTGGGASPAAQSSATAVSSDSGSVTPVAAVKGGQAHVLWSASPVTLMPIFSTSGSEQQVER